tara:strand:+ start:131 stop:778 length:648 start_codon:yes stop_codon:yes gene_type:complete
MKKEVLDVKCVSPQTTGWLELTLPKTCMDKLWENIDESKKLNIDHRTELVGNIGTSLILKDTNNYFFNNILINLVNVYFKKFPTTQQLIVPYVGKNYNYKIDSWWVNFQNKGEFNPIHHHRGIFSFVIWMRIPTNYKEQQQLPFTKNSSKPSAGNFEFEYTNMLGYIEQYEYFMDAGLEATMLFFPSKLMHQVYPFFVCDEKRISISGNICLDIN